MPRLPVFRWSAVKIIVPVLLMGTLVARALGASDRERVVRLEVGQGRIVVDTLGELALNDSVYPRGGVRWDTAHWIRSLVEPMLQADTNGSGPVRLIIAMDSAAPLGLVGNLLEAMTFREVKGLDTARLDLPGGGRVRVHNLPRRKLQDSADVSDGPLELLLEDTVFVLMDGPGAQGLRMTGRPERQESLDSLREILTGLGLPKRERDIELVARLHCRIPMARLIGLAKVLDRATGHGFAPKLDTRQHHLLGISVKKAQGQDWINWEAMKFRKSDVLEPSGLPDTGLRLEGLERLHFHQTSIQALMESGVSSSDEFMASSDGVAVVRLLPLLLTTKLPRVLQHAEEAEYPTSRDFLLPVKVPGHRLVLREVLLQHYTMKEQPCWWALYDNGRRTCIWRYSGGGGKVLPNYTLDSVLVEDGRMTVRLRGGMYRNGYSSLKGVELGFEAMPGRIRLGTVRSAFTFLNDREVVRMEECAGGICSERERQNPSERLQRSCRFVDPQTDAWRFDWKRLQREARCLTQGAGTTISHRKVTEPSFIEAGWKPDTTAH